MREGQESENLKGETKHGPFGDQPSPDSSV